MARPRLQTLIAAGALAALAVNELGETVMSTPAIADGVLYFRARHHLFAIGAPPA